MSSSTTPSSSASDGHVREWTVLLSWIVAGLCALVATSLSISQIRGHRKNWSAPKQQRKIISILWIVPIYAVNSWLSLRYIKASVYIDFFRDCYEAYVLHMFLSLMYTYLCAPDGNPTRMDTILTNMDEDHQTAHHLFPFKYFCQPWSVDRTFLKTCYRGTLQFMILKPTTTVIAVILEANGAYHEGSFSLKYGYIYISFIMNCSITWAAYVLLQFYLVFKKQLQPYSPVPKFLCIKAILFLSFWQAVVLAGFSQFQLIHDVGEYTAADVKTGINNLLLCVEMVLIALAHRLAFPYAQYKHQGMTGSNSSGVVSSNIKISSKEDDLGTSLLNDNFATTDLLRDFNDSGLSIVVPTGFKPSSKDAPLKKEEVNERKVDKSFNEIDEAHGEMGGNVTLPLATKEKNTGVDEGWRL
jgi:hypothetical protein